MSAERRVAIVTGSSGMIGSAIAGRLLSDGLSVAGLDVAGKRIDPHVAPGGGPVLAAYPCDVTEEQDVATILPLVEDELGPIDVLVNNAGHGGPFHRIDEVSAAEWERIMGINVKGPFLLCRALIPRMAERGFGRVVNIASVQGLRGAPKSSSYVTSKHALVGMTRSLALEWGHRGLTVNAVCPGYVATPMGLDEKANPGITQRAMSRIPLGRQADPAEVAALVSFLVSADASYVNGATMTVDGGFSAA